MNSTDPDLQIIFRNMALPNLSPLVSPTGISDFEQQQAIDSIAIDRPIDGPIDSPLLKNALSVDPIESPLLKDALSGVGHFMDPTQLCETVVMDEAPLKTKTKTKRGPTLQCLQIVKLTG